MKLEGKVAVITGGSMGIGEAIAKRFAEEGGVVVITSRDAHRAEEARLHIGHQERTLALACDVRRRGDIAQVIEAVLARHGHIDIWINNAGFGIISSVEQMRMEDCRNLLDTNLVGAIEAMQLIIPVMKRQRSGAIVNISSVSGHIASAHMAAYSASKHAMNAIGHAARLELRGTGVDVITVCPGYISTKFSANAVRSPDALRMGASAKYGVPASRVADATLNAVLKRKRHAVVPGWYWLPIKLYQLCPALVERAMLRSLKPADQVIAAQMKNAK
jgi:short-subunit dehydrogenase